MRVSLLLPLASLAIATACSSSSSHTTAGTDAGKTGDSGSPQPDATAADTGADTGGGGPDATPEAPSESGPIQQTYVRVANWSPDVAAFDFCVAPQGSGDWEGPVLGIAAALEDDAGSLGDAGTHALSFPEVTTYLPLTPGTYDVRLVSSDATDCSLGIAPDATSLPALSADAHSTIAVVGDSGVVGSDAPLAIEVLGDESAPPATGGLALRFINAAPSLPAVTFGEGSLASSNFVPLFSSVAFGAAGTQAGSDAGIVDADGYLSLVDLTGEVSVVAAGATTATASGVSFAGGQVMTVALVGGKTHGNIPPEIIACRDYPGTTAGLLGSCTVDP